MKEVKEGQVWRLKDTEENFKYVLSASRKQIDCLTQLGDKVSFWGPKGWGFGYEDFFERYEYVGESKAKLDDLFICK